jgi:hypothetical protein
MEGVKSDPRGPTALADELEQMECYETNPYVWGLPYSNQPGLWPEGADCRFDVQCESLFCDTPLDSGCGTCRIAANPEEHVNEPCLVAANESVFACAVPGLFCVVESRTCVQPPGLGEPCLPDEHFADYDRCNLMGLECHNGTCIAPLGYQEPCDPSDDTCSQAADLACNSQSVCDRTDHEGPAHVEGECGPFSEGPGDCGYLDACNYTDPMGNNDDSGDCVPAQQIGFGDACDDEDPAAGCPLSMECFDGKCQTRRWKTTCG